MRYISQFAFRNFKSRKLRTFLTTSGIILGVALIVAITVANKNTHNSFNKMFEEASGKADLTISTEGIFSEDVVEEIKKVEGVELAVPSISYRISLLTDKNQKSNVQLLSIDPDIDRQIRIYELKKGNFLSKEDLKSILLTEKFAEQRDIHVGDTIQLFIPKGPESFRIIGLLGDRGIAHLQSGNIGIISIDIAQKLLECQDEITTIDIMAKPNVKVDGLKKILQEKLGESFSVEYPTTKGIHLENLIESMQVALSFLSAIALFVGALLIYNTLSISVEEKLQEISTLRSLGATRAQILKLISYEALIMGLGGSLFGMLAGLGIANLLIKMWSGVMGVEVELVSIPIGSVFAGGFMGLIVTLFAALQPAFAASNISPMEARRVPIKDNNKNFRKLSLAAGLIFLTSGSIIVYRFPGNTFVSSFGIFTLFAGLILVLPITIKPLTSIFLPPIKLIFKNESCLAQKNLQKGKRRTTLVISALVLGLVMTIGVGALCASFKKLSNDYFDTVAEDFIVRCKGPEALMFGLTNEVGIDWAAIDKLQKIEGVESGNPVKFLSTEIFNEETYVIATGSKQIRDFLFHAGDKEKAAKAFKKGGALYVSSSLSERKDIEVEDKIFIKTPQGKKEFEVAAIITHLIPNAVVINYKDAERFFNVKRPDQLTIRMHSSANLTETKNRIKEIADEFGLEVVSGEEFIAETEKRVKAVSVLLNVISGIGILIAALGIINILAMRVLERVREIGILRALGSSRGQIRKIILAEGMFIGLIGGLPGIIFGILISRVLVNSVAKITDATLSYVFPTSSVIAAAIIAIVIGTLAALYPAQKAAKVDIIKAVQYE